MKNTFVILTILLSILCSSASFAQSVAYGTVWEYNVKGRKAPLAGVEIVVAGAGSTISDANGNFKLSFRVMKPGDNILVKRVSKTGYEVFNHEAIEHLLIPRNPNEAPISIVLIKTRDLAKLREKYTNNTEKTLEQQLIKQEEVLKVNLGQNLISQSEYEKRINELESEYEKKIGNIDNYINKFIHIDLSELDKEGKKIVDLVRKGKFDQALALYDELNLIEKYKEQAKQNEELLQAQEKMSSAVKKSADDINILIDKVLRQVSVLQLAGGRDNNNKAMDLLREIAYADTTVYRTMFKYGTECMTQLRYKEAEKAFEHCQESSKYALPLMAQAAIRHGAAQRVSKSKDDCMKDLFWGLNLLDSLMEEQEDSSFYLEDRAYAAYQIAQEYKSRANFTEALKWYDISAGHRKRMLAADPNNTSANHLLSICYKYAADVHMELDDYHRADSLKQLYLSINKYCYNKKPRVYTASLAGVYADYGMLFSMWGDYEIERHDSVYSYSKEYYAKADPLFDTADSLYTIAMQINPEANARSYAQFLFNAGVFHFYLEPRKEAETYYFLSGAKNLYQSLKVEKNIDTSYLLSQCDKLLGYLAIDKKQYSEAIDLFNHGIYSLADDKRRAASVLNTAYGELYEGLADAYFELKNYHKAIEYINKAIEIYPVDNQEITSVASGNSMKTLKEKIEKALKEN